MHCRATLPVARFYAGPWFCFCGKLFSPKLKPPCLCRSPKHSTYPALTHFPFIPGHAVLVSLWGPQVSCAAPTSFFLSHVRSSLFFFLLFSLSFSSISISLFSSPSFALPITDLTLPIRFSLPHPQGFRLDSAPKLLILRLVAALRHRSRSLYHPHMRHY